MAITILPQSAFYGFSAHLRRDEATGCLLWTAARNRGGYGVFHHAQRAILAHRAAWIFAGRGFSDEAPHVLHTCDVRHCCEINHLWAGNKRLNMLDMSVKRRGRKSDTGLAFGVERLPCGSYRARAYLNRKMTHLGCFATEEAAARAAREAKDSFLQGLLPYMPPIM